MINYQAIFQSPDPTGMMQMITEAYNFERELVQKCTNRRLSRVVEAYHHDSLPAQAPAPFPISFIIFERADGDIRGLLDEVADLELAVRLRMVHNAASGIAQLHSIQVAHQDIKPSNLLVFKPQLVLGRTAKIGDLGRATDQQRSAVHDEYAIAGDPSYAPPEQCFGETPVSFEERRLACDIYQLGNLLTFVLSGVTMNMLVHTFLDPSHSPQNWRGSYEQALPYVQAAHSAGLDALEGFLPSHMKDELIDLIECLTDPDLGRRGHHASRKAGQPYALNRIVSQLDLLAHLAEVRQSRLAAA
ncbi:protein kinase domain-containing protein [Arthrobacter livingstonensis]|uniref:protein kinase domain-containing protein n=1 Tax=Arthrobacter livingstonensis TaxID=670078 RepID=UPI001472A5E3|nr:protein kinase [Arthrobacter livingstonensis]